MTQSLQRRLVPLAAAAVLAICGSARAQTPVPDGEWHAIGRDAANTKYSPLDQIDADNFTDLEVAWRWTSLSTAVAEANERIRPSQFKSVPLMADGLVYVSTALGQVAALDAGTGEPHLDLRPADLRVSRPAAQHGLAPPRGSRTGRTRRATTHASSSPATTSGWSP